MHTRASSPQARVREAGGEGDRARDAYGRAGRSPKHSRCLRAHAPRRARATAGGEGNRAWGWRAGATCWSSPVSA